MASVAVLGTLGRNSGIAVEGWKAGKGVTKVGRLMAEDTSIMGGEEAAGLLEGGDPVKNNW